MKNRFEHLLTSFSRLVPASMRAKFETLIRHSGKDHDADIVFGFIVLFGLFIILGSLIAAQIIPFSEEYVPISELEDFDPDFATYVDGEMVSGIVQGLTIEMKKGIVIAASLVLALLVFFGFYGYYYKDGAYEDSFQGVSDFTDGHGNTH